MTTTAEKATTSAETKIAGAQPGKAEKPLDKRRALGRGLDSLLPTSPFHDNRAGWPTPGPAGTRIVSGERARTAVESPAAPPPGTGIREMSAEVERSSPGDAVMLVGLDQIDPNPYQTRMEFDAELLQDLAESIRGNGVVQPIVVRPGTGGRYLLVLGERRCRASKLAGQHTIPAIVRRVSDQQAAEMTVVENLQRQDLNCLEQARAFSKLSQQFGLTQQQIGERVGLSRESVSNYMRLLKLPAVVTQYLMTGAMAFTEARELLKLEDDKTIEKVAQQAVEKHLSLHQLMDVIEDITTKRNLLPQADEVYPARWVDPNVRSAQNELQKILGVKVKIRDRKGKGKIVIEYSSVDDYQRVVGMLKGESR
jgi:ParB family transcriptional regulator, chromosome partitioning protein